jgi:glucose-fructose oxidoreductase
MKNNRRKFLLDSVKAATLLSLPAWVTACGPGKNTQAGETLLSENDAATLKSKTKKKLGVALIGLGYYSTDLLAPALQFTQHCELRGIVTGSPEKIPIWQKRHSIAAGNTYNYENFGTVADNPDIDVLYVVTPTATHAKFAIAAAEAGKHVWCEKPMGMDVKECQSIIDACKMNGVKLSLGYRMQHEPNTQTVIGYAESKPYGAINDLIAQAGFAGSPPTSGWRSQPEMGGGAMYDMGVYTINGLRYAAGMEPIAVRNAKLMIPDGVRVDVTTSYELVFPNGVTAQGRTSIVEDINLLRVNCENGWYELSPMQAYTGVTGRTSDGKLLGIPIQNQQTKQMDDDALAIMNDIPVMVAGIDGLRDIRIVQAIKESAANKGKEVKLN